LSDLAQPALDSATAEPFTVTDPAALARGATNAHPLWGQSIDFTIGVARLDQLPAMDRPEVAFAGRSNVGKSSLINAVTGRLGLARASNTPGRTRQLNLFDVAGQLYLVDLPGYGYARASKSEIKAWTRLTRRYLAGRANLMRVFLLIDARHGLKDSDRELMKSLDEVAVSYQLVLTKADKPSALASVVEASQDEARRHPAAHPELIVTSAVKGGGIAALRRAIAALAEKG
jgi:GTP-binding protein